MCGNRCLEPPPNGRLTTGHIYCRNIVAIRAASNACRLDSVEPGKEMETVAPSTCGTECVESLGTHSVRKVCAPLYANLRPLQILLQIHRTIIVVLS